MAALYAYHSIAYLWMAILGFSSSINVVSVSCPTGDLTYSTDPFSCTATIEFPFPDVVSDQACGAWEIHTEVFLLQDSIVLDTNGQVIETLVDTTYFDEVGWDAPTRVLSGIPIGCHLIRYTVAFECEDVMEYCGFCVEDQVAPSAICDGGRNVYLTSQGSGQLPADNFNAGSNDYCGLDGLQIRRHQYDTLENICGLEISPWGNFIEIFCCDVGDTIDVDLMVTDLAGNASICYSEIYVLDGAQPICQPPAPASIACNELPEDFSPLDTMMMQDLFGVPVVVDNCGGDITEIEPIVNLDACGVGQIIRRFVPIDNNGLTGDTCGQSVMITPFYDTEIRFPKDDTIYVEIKESGGVEIYDYACDSVVWNYSDEYYSASGEACFQILRKHELLFPCKSLVTDSIKIDRDEDCNFYPGDVDMWLLIRNDSTYIDQDADENNQIPIQNISFCDNPEGYWRTVNFDSVSKVKYAQVIQVFDTIPPIVDLIGPPTFCADMNANCQTVDTIVFHVMDSCFNQFMEAVEAPEVRVFADYGADGDIDEELTADLFIEGLGTYTLIHTYPQRQNIIEIHATDHCGNSVIKDIVLETGIDCTPPPIPDCINGMAIELNPVDTDGDGIPDTGPEVTLAATDLLQGLLSDTDLCNLSDLSYSVNYFYDDPDINADSITFDCIDYHNNSTAVVEIYTWDEAGNNSHCSTYLLLGGGNCGDPTTSVLGGSIQTENDNGIVGAFVNIINDNDTILTTYDINGYGYADFITGEDYEIQPFFNEDYLNGISTFDLILISQHILGVTLLNSPYKMLAADVNDSGSITTLDLILLRKLILGFETELYKSWLFIDASFVFTQPTAPWDDDYPESIWISNFPPSSGNYSTDFIAVKLGDVNLDANPILQ